MKIKGVIIEDFVNYKLPALYISFPHCTFKCDQECGRPICQNSALVHEPDICIDKEELCDLYLSNPITQAIVCGGLEPFDSPLDLLPFIDTLRRKYKCNDPVIIYTGYTEEELISGAYNQAASVNRSMYEMLKKYPNIIIKFGRFVPDQNPHYDELLGVKLASPNQYAKEISDDD